MKDRVVLVTGGSRGIGAAVAEQLAAEGYTVVICYEKNDEAAEKTLERLKRHNEDCIAVRADVRSADAVDRLFKIIDERFGGLYGLVSNAGIAAVDFFQNLEEEDWKDVFEVNVHGAYRCIKRALPKMISAKKGRIVFMSSMWGVTGGAMEGAYSATKGALIAMSKTLAKELSYSGITVNAVAPGGVDTEMLLDYHTPEQIQAYVDEVPAGRLARTYEIAALVSYLMSDAAGYMTGEVLNINGGFFI